MFGLAYLRNNFQSDFSFFKFKGPPKVQLNILIN